MRCSGQRDAPGCTGRRDAGGCGEGVGAGRLRGGGEEGPEMWVNLRKIAKTVKEPNRCFVGDGQGVTGRPPGDGRTLEETTCCAVAVEVLRPCARYESASTPGGSVKPR